MPGPKVQWFGAAVNRRKDLALRAGLAGGAPAALAASNARVPVEHGALRASGTAEVVRRGDKQSIAVGYSAPYAAIVHEDMTLHHDDGQAKFLEVTVEESARESSAPVQALASSLRRALS